MAARIVRDKRIISRKRKSAFRKFTIFLWFLGFLNLNEAVSFCKHPQLLVLFLTNALEEIDFIIELYNARRYVRFIEAVNIDNELHLKRKFRLK